MGWHGWCLRLPGEVAICGDNENTIFGTCNRRQVNAAHLKQYYSWAQDAKQAVEHKVSIHHMDGHGGPHCQLADAPAKLAVNLQRGFRCAAPHGDLKTALPLADHYNEDIVSIVVPGHPAIPLPTPEEIFPPIADVATKPVRAKVPRTTQAMREADAAAFASAVVPHVKSLEEYILMRSFPARAEPPKELRSQWAAMVRTAIQRVTGASTTDEKNQAMLDLMVMPNYWLPANVSTKRVIHHFHMGQPFTVDVQRGSGLNEKSKAMRLAELITRKAKNYDLKGAARVMRSEAEFGSAAADNHAEILEKLRSKYPDVLKFPLENSIKDETLPAFSPDKLREVVKKMKRTAAACIDGWQKEHLYMAMQFEPEVADDFCVLAGQVLRQQFSPIVMDCLRAARLVALPKPDGGVRPVAVSNFFCKIIGQLSIKASGTTCQEWQYAVGKLNGTKEVIHKLRKYKEEGKTIAKFDIVNAFNEAPRALGEKAMQGEGKHIRQYFRMMYYHEGTMVVYRRNGHDIIKAREGIRQGDSVSTMIFCKSMDLIIAEILQLCHKDGIRIDDILLYADDLSLVTSSALDCARATAHVKTTFEKYGLAVDLRNPAKSCAMVPDSDPYWRDPNIQEMFHNLGYKALHSDEEFVALGGDIGNYVDVGSTRGFWARQVAKQKSFFELLERVHDAKCLHPAILFTLLRVCGNPRIEYVCSVMPPSDGLAALCKTFDEGVRKILNGPTMLVGRLPEDSPRLYDADGAGFTNYLAIAPALFVKTRR